MIFNLHLVYNTTTKFVLNSYTFFFFFLSLISHSLNGFSIAFCRTMQARGDIFTSIARRHCTLIPRDAYVHTTYSAAVVRYDCTGIRFITVIIV